MANHTVSVTITYPCGFIADVATEGEYAVVHARNLLQTTSTEHSRNDHDCMAVWDEEDEHSE